jgi:hypothetical protein
MLLLPYELHGQLDKQVALIDHPQFKTLCGQDQAMLLRRAALQYLFWGDDIEAARMLISRARSKAAQDRKTLAVYGLTRINPRYSSVIVKWWRKLPGYAVPINVVSLANKR